MGEEPRGRAAHTFNFTASEIAAAAEKAAAYHYERLAAWESTFEAAYKTVDATIGARIERQDVTSGPSYVVTVNYGDPESYSRLQLAAQKIKTHRCEAERYESEAKVYRSQAKNGHNPTYTLTADDVHYFRLHGRRPADD
jgi:hypothetical protein